MDTATVVFLVVGAAGALVLLVSLLFGELLHLAHLDTDGPFSVPAVAGFVGTLGFVGAIGASLIGGSGRSAVLAGVGLGLLGALPVGWLAARLTGALSGMRTDATLTASHLVGATGVVVTPVPATGYGEVRLLVAGQHMKFSARADSPLPTGTGVFVVEAPSETSVVVVPTTALG